MRRSRIVGRVAFTLAFLSVLSSVAFGANGPGWYVIMSSPSAGDDFATSANIGVFSGSFGWPAGNDSIDDIAMYTLTASANPDTGVTWSSNYANCTITHDPPPGGGTGTFNGQGVTPPLVAPNAACTFYITAVPENAATGRDYSSVVLTYGTVSVDAV